MPRATRFPIEGCKTWEVASGQEGFRFAAAFLRADHTKARVFVIQHNLN